MDENERFELEKAVTLLENWLHCGKVDKPRQALLDAMQTAVNTMEKEDGGPGMPYKRPRAVLQYHVSNPLAILFRDPVTINAIKTGIAVMGHVLTRQP